MVKPPPRHDNGKPQQHSPQIDTRGEDEGFDHNGQNGGEELDKLQDPEDVEQDDVEAPHLDAPQELPKFSNLGEDNAQPTERGKEEKSPHKPTTDVRNINTTESLLNTTANTTTANTTESDYYDEVWCRVWRISNYHY